MNLSDSDRKRHGLIKNTQGDKSPLEMATVTGSTNLL